MKTVRKNVYYCDHCKKKGLSPSHMREHETKCTGNLDRQCNMCDQNQPDYAALVEKYKSQMKLNETETADDENTYITITVEQKPDLDAIFDDCEGCPACVLTVLRGCGLCGPPWEMDFSWKKEKDKWWENKKSERDWDY